MKKLIEISAVRPRAHTTSHKCSSLNFPKRKQEALKVAAENAVLASRLSVKSSHFSLREWDEDYTRMLKYKRQISKPHLLPDVKGGKGKLHQGISHSASDL